MFLIFVLCIVLSVYVLSCVFCVLCSIVIVLCTVVPLPPGTYPLEININNNNNNNINNIREITAVVLTNPIYLPDIYNPCEFEPPHS